MISMHTLDRNHIRFDRRLCFSVAAVAIMLFLMFGRLHHYILQSLYESNYYHLGIPALVAVYVAVRGFRDGTGMKILLLYVLWAVLSRIPNGDRFLVIEGDYLIDLSTMILLFAPGVLLQRRQKDRLFDVTAGVIVLFYLAMAAVCIYTATTRTFVENPIDYRGIGYPTPSETRLYFLSYHWNETAGQFLIAFGLCLVLFFRTKNTFLRAGLIVAALADFVTVGLTVSRNGQTCACLVLGLMFGILAVNRMRKQLLWKRIAVFCAVCLLGTVLFYQLFEPARFALWNVYRIRVEAEAAVVNTVNPEEKQTFTGKLSAETLELSEEGPSYTADNRGYLESGRKEIFWSALKSLQMEPKRLLIGSGYYHVMDISHTLIREQAKHFHNTFLQVVNEFGLIGLALVIWFFFWTIKCAFRMIFQPEGNISTGDQMLTLLPVALMGFFMLEVGIFKIVDMANFNFTFYYFACGMLAGAVRGRSL